MPERLKWEDREEALAVLRRYLTVAQIRKVLDRDVERLVARTEYSGGLYKSYLADEELAAFLIDLWGVELLKERSLRQELVSQLSDERLAALAGWQGEKVPKSRGACIKRIVERVWKPGRTWPRYFAGFLGFPKVFAGFAGGPELPPVEEVEPRVILPELHEYQKELVNQVYTLLAAPPAKNRAILSLPTGAGKTRTAVEALLTAWNQEGQSRAYILWVAQSDELCEQAVEAFREVWVECGGEGSRTLLHIYRYWGSRNMLPDVFGDGVVVASIQKLTEGSPENLAHIADDAFAVVVDEAHHATASSYQMLLRTLGMRSEDDIHASTPLLGLTATPYRGNSDENRKLAALFSYQRLIPRSLGEKPVPVLRQMGILAATQHKALVTKSTFDLDEGERRRFEQFQQLPESFLRRVGQDQKRNQLLLQTLLDLPENWPVLFFGCSLEHASAFAVLLRRNGRNAALVTGETRKAMRRHTIEEFRHGHVQFLCNYGVLTTGFDAPKIRAIVIARPTTSVVMYEQMIGRGMRGPRNGGTDECLVIDLVDNIRRFQGQMAYGRFEEYWQ